MLNFGSLKNKRKLSVYKPAGDGEAKLFVAEGFGAWVCFLARDSIKMEKFNLQKPYRPLSLHVCGKQ